VIAALRERRLDRVVVVEPTDAELGAWLPTELAASRRDLCETLDRYWDHDWSWSTWARTQARRTPCGGRPAQSQT